MCCNFTQSTKLRHWQCCTFQELLALLILVGSFWHLLNGMICLGIWLQKIALVAAWPSTPALPFHLGNVRRSTVRTHNLKTWTEDIQESSFNSIFCSTCRLPVWWYAKPSETNKGRAASVSIWDKDPCGVSETYSFRGIISGCIPRPVIHNWNSLFASAQTSIFSQHVKACQELQLLGEKGWGGELKMKFQKKQEMKLYMKSCLSLNLASAATSASVLLITLTPYVTSSQGSFYLNHICKLISLKLWQHKSSHVLFYIQRHQTLLRI